MILRLKMFRPSSVLACFVVLTFFATQVSCLAVMSVDLGSEWMKVAVVSPGVPMEIALNPESKRKTPTAVAFREGERTFGSDALNVGVKYPKNCYIYLLDLLGKKVDHPSVKLFQKRFPFYEIVEDPQRGTVAFKHDENTVFTVEELMGMILTHAKNIAEEYTEQKIRDTVLTVPVYFNQAERRSLLAAAELANLNVLQLITEPMATALNYGMFRRKEINGTVKHLLFYDMGAYDTTATLVSYQIIKTKERGFSETHPQAQILGVGYDRTLGGIDLQLRLREYLADEFNKLKKTKTDVRTVPRAMAKLFAEAGKVKNVLSANVGIFAQVENLLENIDVKIEVTRDTFLEINKDYFSRVTGPIDQALLTSSITMDEISEVILMGGGTRVPRVQELLSEYLISKGHKSQGELGKSLNTDEASAMGAVYKSADLSTGFKVKKFITKDAVIFPIDIDFERTHTGEDTGTEQTKIVKRSLFSRMNIFPQKKLMTFNKHVSDFTFNVNLNEVDYLGAKEVASIGSLNLSKVAVKGVAETLEQHKGDNIESKGIKAHFNFDESGLLQITSVEAVFEKNVTVKEQEAVEDSSNSDNSTDGNGEKKDDSWAKFGDTISSFFGDKKDEDGKPEGSDKKPESKKDAKKEEKKVKKEPKKPKIETIKAPLVFEVTLLDLANITEDQKKASRDKLDALDEHDRQKKAKAVALNTLESFVVNTRVKLSEDIWEKSSTEDEREKISAKLSEVGDWIDEEVTQETEVSVLEAKLKELTDLTSPLSARVKEHTDRPEALDALFKMINSSDYFLAKAKNSTGIVDGYFTQAELDILDKKLADIKTWKENAEKEQGSQPMYEMPKLTTSLIAEKGIELDREVKYLVNKAKIARAEKERERLKKEAEEKLMQEEKRKSEEKAKKKQKKLKEGEEKTSVEEPADSQKDENETPSDTEKINLEDSEPDTEIPLDADSNESVEESAKEPVDDNEEEVSEPEKEDSESEKEDQTEKHTEL